MTNENYEDLSPEAPEDTPAPEETSAPEVSPEPVEADPAPEPAPDPAPDPVVPSAPVEVVTVDDLLDRLADDSQEGIQTETEDPSQTEESLSEEESVSVASEADLPDPIFDGGPVEVIGMDKALAHLKTIQQQTAEHPMMTTPFEDYTVTEGLLLLVFVILLLDFFLNILRRWF